MVGESPDAGRRFPSTYATLHRVRRTLTTLVTAEMAASKLIACGTQDEDSSAEPTAVQSTDPTSTVLTVETVNAANSTLEELTGAPLSEIQVQQISITPSGNLSVDGLDPAKPTELNQYVAYPNGRTDIRPYDYGGAENYEALLTRMFAADLVSPETMVGAREDSFNHVEGDRADMTASGVTVSRASSGEVEIYVVNGPERDRQTVYFDADGAFLRVS